MYGGDGFWMFTDPTDNDYLYTESQGGDIARVNRKTHEVRGIKPLPNYKEGKLRYNWNTPIHVSPTGAVYLGSQYLFRTRDHGQTWERISPDLTTNNPEKQRQEQSGGVTVDNSSAEMNNTIYAIAESPKNKDVVWVGTDDGNVQVTRDAGKSWTNVTKNLPLAPNAWISYVEAGHFDEGSAFVTVDMHTTGDMKPYVYRTGDFGQTWTSLIPANTGVNGYAHVVREDLVNPHLLYVGTEHGLWISLDDGKQWAQYKGGDMPVGVAVRDLAIHPRDNDLVVATHGRGIWIIDDITPLRALTPDVMAKEAEFLQTAPAVQRIFGQGGWYVGDAQFSGNNPPGDAVITYYQKKRHIFGDLKIDVLDSAGNVIGTIPSSKRRGLNRITWSMRTKGPKVPPAASAAFGAAVGPRVMPGTYTVRMTKDKNVYTTPLRVITDPRATYTPEDRKVNYDLAVKLKGAITDMAYSVEQMNAIRSALDDRASKLPANDATAKKLRAASDSVDTLRKKLVATKEGGMITGEERLRENITDVYGGVIFYEGRPSQMQVDRTESISREMADVDKDFSAWAAKELPSINAALAKKNLPPIKLQTRSEWDQSNASEAGGSPTATEQELKLFERD
jgi:hypothetical protein